MIKEAYFRGLMKVAQATDTQTQQWKKDRMLLDGIDGIQAAKLQEHGFYKNTPIAQNQQNNYTKHSPSTYRFMQSNDSAYKFSPSVYDPVMRKLREYYQSIGRQNRDFYLKQGFRPPKDHKYKTPFPYPNHPKKKQMMLQNQNQVRNTRGAQDYSGHA